MKITKFNEYTERCLSLARGGGWGKEICAKEELAWTLHAEFPPTGSVLLGHLLLTQKVSHTRKDVKAREFARSLLSESVPALQAIEEKDGWDHYYLGICHIYGRGLPQSYSKAVESFEAACAQNPYANYEAIWARYLAGGSRFDALLGFMRLSGPLSDFAALSSRALGLLETGPVREVGSHAHLARLVLLRGALHSFIYHDHGAKLINIAVEKELREGVEELRQLKTTRGYLGLYLIATSSRANPTGRSPIEWFQDALDPSLEELQILCERRELGFDELKIIVERAERDGWLGSRLAVLAKEQLDPEE
jgi:hypothetical protein